jgi:hypothetical protein
MLYRLFLAPLAFAALLLTGCTPTTNLTATWTADRATSYDLDRVAVVGLSGQRAYGGNFEMELADDLREEGIQAVPSRTMLPQDYNPGETDRETMIKMLDEQNIDGVMIVSIRHVEDESYYVPGETYYQPEYYYNTLYDYYVRSYDTVYDPGYYLDTQEYYVETNIYDVIDGEDKLIYSAQSMTFDPRNLNQLSTSLAEEIMDDLANKAII